MNDREKKRARREMKEKEKREEEKIREAVEI